MRKRRWQLGSLIAALACLVGSRAPRCLLAADAPAEERGIASPQNVTSGNAPSATATAKATPDADESAGLGRVFFLVPSKDRQRLDEQLRFAGASRQQWIDAVLRAKPKQGRAVAFLLANMPKQDLISLKSDFLLRNVELAYEARAKTPWAAAVPNEIFLNDVLPYANLNERRDDWRGDFFGRFFPLVKNCKSAAEAAQVLNREVFKAVSVCYSATKRPKPDQSPCESIEAHYASCSGLSILLVDACRAVGVPARVVGTRMWADKSGNHTWVEIWDGQWRYMGAAEPGEFNKTWFSSIAAKASAPETYIYAASFRRTFASFPLVWDPTNRDYPAIDVTGYYVDRRTLTVHVGLVPSSASVPVRIEVRQRGVLVAEAQGSEAEFNLAADTTYSLTVTLNNGQKINKQVHLPKDADLTVELP
jgi:hypothetical protein